MPSPGWIAVENDRALRDLEAGLAKLAAALDLEPFAPTPVKHLDRAYIDMLRARALADWLTTAAARLEVVAPADPAPALADRLTARTKAQLLALADALGVEGLSEELRKDEIAAALATDICTAEG